MIKRLGILVGCLMVAGCATAPEVPPLSASAAAAMPTEVACELYAISDSAETKHSLRVAMDARGDVAPDEWGPVDAREVRMGIGRCAVLAMFGKPDIKKEAGGGIEVLGYNSGRFISLQNGRVISFQVPN